MLISEELQIPPEILLNLVDEQAFPEDRASSSVLRIINYNNTTRLPTDVHEDLGLLTFISYTGVPALEIYDYANDSGWLDVEAQQNADDVIVMAGESLSFISNGYYLPATHRVRTPDRPRIAINYHLRLRQNAKLDSNLLISAIKGNFPQPFCLSANDFLQREIHSRKSVNASY